MKRHPFAIDYVERNLLIAALDFWISRLSKEGSTDPGPPPAHRAAGTFTVQHICRMQERLIGHESIYPPQE